MKKNNNGVTLEIPSVGEVLKMTALVMIIAFIVGYGVSLYDDFWNSIVSFFISLIG